MPVPLLTDHRLARLAAWLMAVLAWFALGAPLRSVAQRRHYERYGNVDLHKLRRAVRGIILIRAARFMPARAPLVQRDYAPRGFRRRSPRVTCGGAAGAWLRRRLRTHGSLARQALHLLSVLRRYRALGAELACRRRKGLTRLGPILMIAAFADPAPVGPFAPTAFSDTS